MWQRIETFFLKPASPRPLGLLRIGIAFVLLLQAWSCRAQFFDLYGTKGILQNQVSERFARGGFFQLTELARLAQAAFGISERPFLLALAALYLFTLVLFLV